MKQDICIKNIKEPRTKNKEPRANNKDIIRNILVYCNLVFQTNLLI